MNNKAKIIVDLEDVIDKTEKVFGEITKKQKDILKEKFEISIKKGV